MAFDFDRAPDRTGGDSVKWNRWAGRDVLPMWVADMDFAVAYEVPVAREVSVGGRAVLWWRWAGGSADVPGLDATLRGAGVATVTWRAF